MPLQQRHLQMQHCEGHSSTRTRKNPSTGKLEQTFAESRIDLNFWYRTHCRDLPWRRTRDPYKIWISEIMLQQTRVAVVIERYRQFLRLFPNLKSLAQARESAVLAAWSGLGYYRRARMLHRAARQVVRQYRGRMPRSARELQALPGIGRYTAAAIASIAYHEPVAVVDGNVERVIGRFLGNRGTRKIDYWREANRLLDPRTPGDFNQAMMELGATICTPLNPGCERCPLGKNCKSNGKVVMRRAVPQPSKAIVSRYRLSENGERVLLVQRPRDAKQMPGMWELPAMQRVPRSAPALRLRHSITTKNYEVLIHRTSNTNTGRKLHGRWIERSKLPRTALTGLTRKVLQQTGWLG